MTKVALRLTVALLTLPLLTPTFLQAATPATSVPAKGAIDPQRLSDITRTLSSDEFEGRAPGTVGETKAIAYLVEQFKAAGLEPAGPDDSYVQVVPLVRTQVPADASMSVTVAGKRRPLTQQQDMAALALRPVDRVRIENAPLVFVGYGVSAPERGWDDYKDVDLRGKVAVYLINDPDFEAIAGEDAYGKFGGRAATYYARWTYKYEEAARRGAIAALIVHETEPAAYGWNTAIAPNGEGYDIVRADPAKEKLLLQSWLHRDAAVEILRGAGLDFEALKKNARSKAFQPVELRDSTFAADFPLGHARIDSHNVLGKITGGRYPNESIMIGGHWDAYGSRRARRQRPAIPRGRARRCDRHGRRDRNRTRIQAGSASGPHDRVRGVDRRRTRATRIRVLCGPALAAARRRPSRISRWTCCSRTASRATSCWSARVRTNWSHCSTQKAAGQGRVVTPDAKPERGLAFRADHFPFAKRGVPTLVLMGLGGGHDLVNGGRAAGDRWVSEFTAQCYHQACDRWSDAWDLSGAAQDVTLVYQMTLQLANSRAWPQWNPGSEFRAVRDSTVAQRK